MRDAPQAAPDRPLIPAADPLVANVLRAALEAYLRGDYVRAARLWLDASALMLHRPEQAAWRFLGHTVEGACELGELESVDAARDDLERRR